MVFSSSTWILIYLLSCNTLFWVGVNSVLLLIIGLDQVRSLPVKTVPSRRLVLSNLIWSGNKLCSPPPLLIEGQLGGESGFWEVLSSSKFSQQDQIVIDNVCEGHHQIANWQNPEKLQTWQTRRQSRPTFEQFRKQFSFPQSLHNHYSQALCVGRLSMKTQNPSFSSLFVVSTIQKILQ